MYHKSSNFKSLKLKKNGSQSSRMSIDVDRWAPCKETQ